MLWTNHAEKTPVVVSLHRLILISSISCFPSYPQVSIFYSDAMRCSLLSPVIFFPSICSAQLKRCYDVNGNPISQIPCDPSANVSACCAPGAFCQTNLYCHGGGVDDTFDSVGGCTDETGNDPACPLPLLRGMTPYCHVVSGIESALLMV